MDLPAKEKLPRSEIVPNGLGFQQVVANGEVHGDASNNNLPMDTRRHTYPSIEPPKKEEHAKVKRCQSALPPSLLEEKKKINLSNDLLSFVIPYSLSFLTVTEPNKIIN